MPASTRFTSIWKMFIDRVSLRCGPSDILAALGILNRKRGPGLYKLAGTVLYLSSPESAFIVGIDAVVDGEVSQL
jgi:hypothetical protein